MGVYILVINLRGSIALRRIPNAQYLGSWINTMADEGSGENRSPTQIRERAQELLLDHARDQTLSFLLHGQIRYHKATLH